MSLITREAPPDVIGVDNSLLTHGPYEGEADLSNTRPSGTGVDVFIHAEHGPAKGRTLAEENPKQSGPGEIITA